MTVFAIGQDSHAFEKKFDPLKPLKLGGLVLDGQKLTLRANSDGDVILHALTNAISGITCRNILGSVADGMCRNGITDSAEYLKVALKDLSEAGFRLVSVSISVEAKKPVLSPFTEAIRENIASICGIPSCSVGMTATTGEGLTAFGRGLGIQVFCAVTAEK
ncbi:MAG: 2-C-methyl-D-erythritol 2,4-cyclodiphosphate synthase [Clostridia bacterium]|nr:2-C-methyl-D-erythritol 2,4-cyclodiphosphate synthase [Clostridia bacterium]